MRLSVVIATYLRPAEVERLLLNLAQQTRVPDDVIVVDSSPDQQTRHAVERMHALVSYRLVYVPCEKGLTRQRNAGVRHSSGEIILFLDDDVLLEPGFVQAIEDVFKQDKDGTIGGVCGYILNEVVVKPRLKWRIRQFLLPGLTLHPGHYHRLTGYSVPLGFSEPFKGVREVDYLVGGATAYKGDIVRNWPFEEYFEGYGQGEDLHYSLRVGQNFRLLQCGDACLQHLHAPSGRPDPRQRGAMVIRNRYYIYQANKDPGGSDVWFWWAVILDVLTGLLALIRGPQRSNRFRFVLGMLQGVIDCFRIGKPNQRGSEKRGD